MNYNWMTPCEYNEAQKIVFHRGAARRLRLLAKALEFNTADYDIRSNQGGIAVSGEITLHHKKVYVQVSQSALGPSMGILIRTCNGRKDYTGGPNTFAPLSSLNDDLSKLVNHITRVLNS